MPWENYYKTYKKSDTSRLLLVAEKFISNIEGKALDIGSGTGRDIPFLLSKGFEVTAIDPEKESVDIINDKFKEEENLHALQSSIEEFELEPNMFNFINAQFVLFFINQNSIEGVLEKIKASIIPGGIFCGQILGKKDDWANWNYTNYLNKGEIKKIFSDFKILLLEEIKQKGKTASEKEKFWNFYHLIARKL